MITTGRAISPEDEYAVCVFQGDPETEYAVEVKVDGNVVSTGGTFTTDADGWGWWDQGAHLGHSGNAEFVFTVGGVEFPVTVGQIPPD